jgi:hypothetical protein
VTKGLTKTPPLRLPEDHYQALCRRVLERDGWRCQNCGRRDQLSQLLNRAPQVAQLKNQK